MDFKKAGTLDKTYKFLHFVLGGNHFAIRLSEVTEIIKLAQIRKIPRVADFIEGVLHLRGENVIIVNLGRLLHISETIHEKAKIIIFTLFERRIGFIVDNVTKIIQKKENEILPPPPVIIQGPAPDFITGVFEENEHNILMIDLRKSLAALEEESINQVLARELSFLIDQINE